MTTGNTVSLKIEVSSDGLENLQNVNKEFKDLGTTTDKTTTALVKHDDSMRIWNTSLTKQIPAMQMINPLLNTFNLGMLTSVGAMGLAGYGMMQLVQGTIQMSGNLTALGGNLNAQTIGPLMTYQDLIEKLAPIASSSGFTIKALSNAMNGMNPEITDAATQFNILTLATKIASDTGMDLKTVVQDLSGAYTGQIPIRDKVTGQLLLGNNALQQELINLEAGKNATGQFTTALKNFFDNLFSLKPQLKEDTDAIKQLAIQQGETKKTTDAATSSMDAYAASLNKALTAMRAMGTSPLAPYNPTGGVGYSPIVGTFPSIPGSSSTGSMSITNNITGVISNDVINELMQKLDDYFRNRGGY